MECLETDKLNPSQLTELKVICICNLSIAH